MLTHNTHYASNERFLVRYNHNGYVTYITSNRRLTLDQSKAKVFDNFFMAERFCYRDIESGKADVVSTFSL